MHFDNQFFLHPFSSADLEWKPQSSGFDRNGKPYCLIVPYVTARAIQDRLDNCVGSAFWSATYEFLEKGVICTLAIKINGEWVKKVDGSDFSDIEAFKGGISGAFKRAAVHWGIGRYLYDMDQVWADLSTDRIPGSKPIEISDKKRTRSEWYYWSVPKDNNQKPIQTEPAQANGTTQNFKKPSPQVIRTQNIQSNQSVRPAGTKLAT